MATLTTSIEQSSGTPVYSNQTRKRSKSIQVGRKKVKLSLFVDDIIDTDTPKVSTQKLLGLANEFSKVAK